MLIRHLLLATTFVALSFGCLTRNQHDSNAPSRVSAPKGSCCDEDTFQNVADRLVDRARHSEPLITSWIQALALTTGAELVGLGHRLKTKRSILRKLHLLTKDNQHPATAVIDDTVRYKLQIEDKPPGNHTSRVAEVLRAAELKGHEVVRVKNYWPSGDNYSGINAVLRSSSGLLWELQFHTRDSLLAVKKTRKQYEELRAEETRLNRKRELFDDMTETWDNIPIPEHVLDPQSLHRIEEIRERPRP